MQFRFLKSVVHLCALHLRQVHAAQAHPCHRVLFAAPCRVHSTPYNHLPMGLHGILRLNPGVQLSDNAALPCRLIGLYLRGPNQATLHHRGSS